jgi:hypothetical protein
MKTNKDNESQVPLSERMLPFPNMTMMPRSIEKLPYHAPVTNGEIHPERKKTKRKKKKTKNKSKSKSMNELREIIRKIISESEDDNWFEYKDRKGNTHVINKGVVDDYGRRWENMDVGSRMSWLSSAGYEFANPEKIENKTWDSFSDKTKGELTHVASEKGIDAFGKSFGGRLREADDWGDSDKIGRAADFEREGKKELYYVVDGNGNAKHLSTNPMSAYEFLEKNFPRLGGGQVKVKVVRKDDWDNERINVGNIKAYKMQ